MADIAGYAAIAARTGAGLSLLFSILGFSHASKVARPRAVIDGLEPATFIRVSAATWPTYVKPGRDACGAVRE